MVKCQICKELEAVYWLEPNELWVCEGCDRNEVEKVKIGLIARTW